MTRCYDEPKDLMAENEKLRAQVAELRAAARVANNAITSEWPDGRDGANQIGRTPGLVRAAKDSLRAALAATDDCQDREG